MLIITAFAISNEYFDKRAGTASGLLFTGGGVGGLILPYVVQILVKEYTYRGASLINGALILNTVFCAALFRPIVKPKSKKTVMTDVETSIVFTSSTVHLLTVQQHDRFSAADVNVEQAACHSSSSISEADTTTTKKDELDSTENTKKATSTFAWKVLKDIRVWVFALCMVLHDVGFFNITLFLPIKSIELGGETVNEAMSVSLFGAGDTLGRLLCCTLLWDRGIFKTIYGRQFGFFIIVLFTGTSIASTGFVQSYRFYLTWSLIVGLLNGSALSPTFVIMQDIIGQQNFADAISVAFVCEAPASFLAPLFLGAI